MTQNPPEQPGGQQGPFGPPGQYGAGGQQPQPGYGQAQGAPGPEGQPDYGGQPAYGGQPGYGGQPPYGGQPSYGGPPPTGAGGQGPTGPATPMGPPPGGGPQRSHGPMIAGIIIGGVVVLALLIWGAITLIDGRDDTIPTPTPSSSTPADQPSDDSSDESSEEPSDDQSDDSGTDQGGELYNLLTSEGAQVQDTRGNTWAVQGDWTDASDLSADAMEAYTATYASDAGELTLTALSFPDVAAADDYIARVKDERGDPDSEGQVWQSDNGNGLGTRLGYSGDDSYSIYWYDDTAVVYQVDADDVATASDFYGSLSF